MSNIPLRAFWSVPRLAVLVAVSIANPAEGRGQAVRPTPPHSALEVREVADSAAIDWMRGALTEAEIDEVLSLLDEIPEGIVAADIAGYFHGDPSYAYLQALPGLQDEVAARLDSLAALSASPSMDRVREAYQVARIRHAIVDAYCRLPWYRYSFEGDSLDIPAAPRSPAGFDLVLDLSPAATILDILEQSDLETESIEGQLARHAEVFEALIDHRGQSFYPAPLTRATLVRSLELATSSAPAARLYRFAFPVGLLHYAEVREQLGEYRRLVTTLAASEGAIEAYAAERIAPYMPAGMTFSRTVHFLFADGADGWVSNGVAAIDLEFLKDDGDQLLTVLTHETFHAVQSAARKAPFPEYAERRHELLAPVLENIFQEGTANYVAPAQALADAEREGRIAEGVRLLDELGAALQAETPDEARVRALQDEGVQGAGPFYWLGARMAEVIDRELGPDAIATSLEEGGVRFFELYQAASASAGSDAPVLPADIVRAIGELGGS